jgi:hypothetical protein
VETESAAAAYFALDFDVAAHFPNQPAADAQSEAGATKKRRVVEVSACSKSSKMHPSLSLATEKLSVFMWSSFTGNFGA